jgi:hypothetical protein
LFAFRYGFNIPKYESKVRFSCIRKRTWFTEFTVPGVVGVVGVVGGVGAVGVVGLLGVVGVVEPAPDADAVPLPQEGRIDRARKAIPMSGNEKDRGAFRIGTPDVNSRSLNPSTSLFRFWADPLD